MLLRIRWFLLGALSSLGTIAYLAVQVRIARERLSAAALGRSGSRTVASLLDRTADLVAPDPQPPKGTAPNAGAPDAGDPASPAPQISPAPTSRPGQHPL
jgi:hypothetical protein